MTFTPEIKNFIKNTAIFTVIFALLINFSWDNIVTMLGYSAKAQNDANFENANMKFMGNTATALSLKLAGVTPGSSVAVLPDASTITISEVMSNPSLGQEKLIASNMLAIKSYSDTLKKNIIEMMNSSNNRAMVLDNHISLLKSYYLKTEDKLAIIKDQKNDLNALMQKTNSDQANAKTTLQNSYEWYEYTGVDNAINSFLQAKNTATRAKIYMIYLDGFEKSYAALQNKNKKVLDAIINNREGLINKSVVVVPDTGSDIIKELGLIETEAEAKAKKTLQE